MWSLDLKLVAFVLVKVYVNVASTVKGLLFQIQTVFSETE